MSSQFDIVIVGAGPAGLVLSTCLAKWGHRVKHIDERSQPSRFGRADAIQPRYLELLRNIGLKPEIMRQNPVKLYEISNWEGCSDNKLRRTSTHSASPPDVLYPFVTILSQGAIERAFVSKLADHSLVIDRPWALRSFKVDKQRDPEYPVIANLEHTVSGEQQRISAKYLIGADGAKSLVRQSLGVKIQYKGAASNVWGVIDGLISTDFPDSRVMCNVRSQEGSVLLVPRENDHVRFYVHLASDGYPNWQGALTATDADIKERVKAVLMPYYIEWEQVTWWSVYPIRQGVAERYTLDERVFLVGDACHTHSPKAAQGMNTAFLDSYNLAWKLHHVELGIADRNILKTYEQERRHVAQILISFDEQYARTFSQRLDGATTGPGPRSQKGNGCHASRDELSQLYKKACLFISGYGIHYQSNVVNWSMDHPIQYPAFHKPNSSLQPGHLFPSSIVIRVTDANPVQLSHAIPCNGSFRILVFAGKPERTANSLMHLTNYLIQDNSFLSSFLRPDVSNIRRHEKDNPHSLLFTICVIFASKRSDLDIRRDVPGIFFEYRHHVYTDELVGSRDPGVATSDTSAHRRAGIDESLGAVVVVRPDGYVSAVAGLTEGSGTSDALNGYFSSFCKKTQ